MSDPAKIAAVLPALQANYFMSDGGYLVAAKIAGRSAWVYRYLPAAAAPDFVTKGAL